MFCTIFLRKIYIVLHFFTTNLHCFTKFTYEFWLNHRSHGHDATNIVGFSSMCWIELFTLAIPNFDLDDFHVLNAFVVCNVFICLYQPLRVLCHQISKSSICNYSCRVLWAILPLVNKILYVYIYIYGEWRVTSEEKESDTVQESCTLPCMVEMKNYWTYQQKTFWKNV